MARSMQERFRAWADEMDAEERDERERKLQEEIAELRAGGLSTAEREELATLRARLDALEAADRRDDTPDDPDPADDPDPGDDPDDPAPRKRMRPGRKSGMAYDWTVDDDGQVVDLDIAAVWTGEDEPDRVELPS